MCLGTSFGWAPQAMKRGWMSRGELQARGGTIRGLAAFDTGGRELLFWQRWPGQASWCWTGPGMRVQPFQFCKHIHRFPGSAGTAERQ